MEGQRNSLRGSEWRKWDLHIHTPNSICQYYGNTPEGWEKFICALENLPEDVKVIGITDYYFIDGYEKVMDYKLKQNRLKNIDKIFPNLEFRIDTFGSGNENYLQKINLHIIFDLNENDLEKEIKKVKEEFINKIPLTRSEKHITKCLSIDNFTQEGQNSLKAGFSSFVPPTDQVFKLLDSPTWKDKTFLLLGYKEWSNLEKIQQMKPLKEELYSKVGAFLGSNYSTNEKNQSWLNEFGKKRLLHSLDIHSFTDLDTYEFEENGNKKPIVNYHCNTWIKADCTFNGLKQILFEPEERVSIQEIRPDDKRGYQVIDSITLNEDKFWNNTLYFNGNLNTIVGGRSTGKSTLLKSIAKKINNKVKLDDEREFIKNHLAGVSIKWHDGEEGIERDIDFFPQSYMHDIAKNKKETDSLINDIIKTKEESRYLKDYESATFDLKKRILQDLIDLFQLQEIIDGQRTTLKELGDKKGVETEIQKLESKIAELNKNSSITEQELAQYADSQRIIKESELAISQDDNDLRLFPRMKVATVFKHAYPDENEFESLIGMLNRTELYRHYNNLKLETERKWLEIVERFERDTLEHKQKNILIVEHEKKNPGYIRGSKYYSDNKELSDMQSKLVEEGKKLAQIVLIENKIAQHNKRKQTLFVNVINAHTSLFDEANNVLSKLNIEHEGVKISPKLIFQKQNQQDFLEYRLNLRGSERQKRLTELVDKYEHDLKNQSESFLATALNNEIDYKNNYSNEHVVSEFLSTNWFDISFELSYQGDVFDEMSQGKQAFVILKLLLEFSSKECPILIDQPEDSLDNRAIYNELVHYLRLKKKQRQIILVTHNPNVVVSADAENVIVANQHGKDSFNRDGVKFQYVNGSLENTKLKHHHKIILESQGIREHVCEILEGGREAFEKREKKYGFKE